ncbi:MAG: Ppx/GppA phosphatase family protein [Pseudomonadota bacterium]
MTSTASRSENTVPDGKARKHGQRPSRNGGKKKPGSGANTQGTGPQDTVAPYAALDLGTNNCRLLIAKPLPRGFRVIDAFSRIVRLGEGMSRTGAISDAAMDRAISALRVCRDKLETRHVGRARLIATEACRIASNGEEFLERVRDATGLDLEIVDRETEARLAVSGSASLVDREADGAMIFDIGGGSTELIWLDQTKSSRKSPLTAHRRIGGWTSVPLGVVKLSEMFGGERVTPEIFEAMVAETLKYLDDFGGGHAAKASMDDGGNIHLLGTSGTVTTLAGVYLDLPRYDRRRVDGVWLQRADMMDVTQRLLNLTHEERQLNGCIGTERADLVLPGCAILEAICRSWPCERLRVADRGLREGILTTLMAEDGVWLRHRRRPRRNRGGGRTGRANGGTTPASTA